MLTIKTTIYPAIIGFLWLFHNSALALSLHLDSFSNEQGLTQNSVTCSITDRRGFHWFATQGGLNRFDGYEFKRFKSHPTQPSLSSNWITDCVTTDNNLLWFSTATQGLNALNTETGTFTHFNRNSPLAIKDNRIWSMLTDQHNNLWLGHEDGNLTRLNVAEHETAYFTYSPNTQGSIIFQDMVIDAKQNLWLASNEGLIKFDTKTAKFSHFSASKKQLWRLKLTPQGQLLIASKTGLSVFDLESEQFNDIKQLDGIWISDILIDNNEHLWLSSYGQGLYYNPNYQTTLTSFSQFKHLPQQRHGLVNDYLLSLYQDQQGILWIGTDGYGLQRYDMRQNQFNHQQHSDDPNSISHDFIRALLKDSQGQLWVGTRNGLNRQTKDGFVRYHVDTSNLTNNNIFSLHEDSQQRIWIGTYGGGLLRYNRESDDFTSFTVQSHQLSSNNIYALTSDRNGNLWLGSNQGLSLFNPDNLTIEHFKHSEQHNSISNNTVFSLVYDNVANAIWAGTRVGLNKLTLNNNEFSHYQADQTNPNSLSHNMVTALHLQDDNTLWVGTFGGLNKLNKTTAEITRITEHDGLLNDNIFAIKQDAKGYLWLASNQGLTRYQPSSENMQHFLPRDGVQHNSFILGAAYQAQNSELFFGGINGFNQFDPLKLQLAATTPEPVLTELLINNQAIATAPYTKHETQAAKLISYIQTLSFNKGVGVIGFKFSALHSPSAPQQYQYAYKLAGFDKQFLYTNAQQRQINYPQLPAGDYQLQLKVKDQYGQWSNAKAMLDFTVVPPWWQSRLAYAGYVLLTGVIIWLIAASLYRAKLAEQTSKQARELNRLKSQFLDNISHELKTPLSLILAPLESLQLNHKDQASQKQLSMIKRNSLRLLTLINQLLQLSQRPSCAIHYVSPYPLAPFIKQLVADFTVLFEQKGIHVTMTDLSQGSCCIALEPEHATSIITNLVSNALKYTHSGGQVEISLSVHNNMAHIAIVDTGIGIEKHQQGIIFERFTRVAAQNQNGSGIGLALVKQLLEQYGGQISLTSEVGKGSCFTVSLPLTEAEHGATSLAASVNEATRPSNSQKLLIVEDNDEMRELLLTLFATEYHCLSAINGEQGLAICQTEMPDLVISDVMMPCMDGYQLLNALRTNNITSHIPVLLLSAKADTQSRLKGLDLLADDFLSKPFEPQLLLSRVQGLLSIRAVLNRHLAKQLAAHAPPLVLDPQLTQSKDYQFTERLKNIIRDNYHNEAFSIEEFAAGLYLSTRALQLKMKALYNLTPSDYIRNTRLEYAEKLLSDSDLSIGLIAEKVGFSSQSYFARCFKAKHNVSPKQFRENTNLNAKTSSV